MTQCMLIKNPGEDKTFYFCDIVSQWYNNKNLNKTFTVDFEVESISYICWRRMNNTYDYGTLEASVDGSSWTTIFNHGGRGCNKKTVDVKGKGYKHFRVKAIMGTIGDDAHCTMVAFSLNKEINFG